MNINSEIINVEIIPKSSNRFINTKIKTILTMVAKIAIFIYTLLLS